MSDRYCPKSWSSCSWQVGCRGLKLTPHQPSEPRPSPHGGNEIGALGVMAVAECARFLSGLLKCCWPDPSLCLGEQTPSQGRVCEGTRVHCLRGLTTRKELILSENKVGNEGATHLAKASARSATQVASCTHSVAVQHLRIVAWCRCTCLGQMSRMRVPALWPNASLDSSN